MAAGRRQLNRAAREQALVEAAFEEFVQRGYSGARLVDIAKRAGVASGLVIFYFGTKANLFDAVIRRQLLSKVFSPIELLLEDPAAKASDIIRVLIHTMCEELVDKRESRELMRLILAESPKFPELSELYYQAVVALGLDNVRRILGRGADTGEFRADVVDLPAQVIHGVVAEALLWALLFRDRHSIDTKALMEAHCRVILEGLTPRG